MKRTPHFPQHNAEAILVAHKLSNAEARFVVSDYYAAQEARKRADMQLRHLGDKASQSNFPLLLHSAKCNAEVEQTVLKGLERFAEASPIGRWMLAQHGVGPVIAAGMLAHLDITRAQTAGAFWKFAGLDPSTKWEKGEKRPYNAQVKQLCFHFGECAKRTSNAADSFYGAIYREEKAKLVARNEAGGFAEKAAVFVTKDSAEQKKIRASGKVPPHYLDKMATRYAAKIFLSHLQAVMFWDKYGKAPPKPFAISILGHAHEIRIPHADMFPGFEEAYYGRGLAEAAE